MYTAPVLVPEEGAVTLASVRVERIEGRKMFWGAVLRGGTGNGRYHCRGGFCEEREPEGGWLVGCGRGP
ncbi:hypothetical protein BJX63DRAFT_400305, partial [Aspergillus granulosus]